MGMLEILILSMIQGVTEFIPVSSSSHLILIAEYSNFVNHSLYIDVSLHIGSLLAVISYFYKDIFYFIKNKYLLTKILLSSGPIIIVGYLLVKLNIIQHFRNLETIGWTTIIFGILLFISDKVKIKNNFDKNLTFKSIIIIGFFQVLSLIPGVSRAGITITACRMLRFNRFDSSKISFLMAIPVLGAVSIFGIFNISTSSDLNFSLYNLYSILFSYIFSIVTIKFFLDYIKKFSLNIFVAYRILLGFTILFFNYL